MASIYSAIACPHCGCCATEDYYYKLSEKFIWCYRCGYYYEKIIDRWEEDKPVYVEKELIRYGQYLIDKDNGKSERKFFDQLPSKEEISNILDTFTEQEINLDNSYLTIYTDGAFKRLREIHIKLFPPF